MNDRQEKIYGLLQKNGSVSVELLKKEIWASEATLRRDLAQMEREGLLVRTWGGAVAKGGINSDPPLFVRSNTNKAQKNTIAGLASAFLEHNMTVFLASGTTVARLAGALHRYENLTVITNGLETANALRSHLSAKVILPGGELHEDYDLVGTLTERTIEQFNADLFFFSCSGITAEGFTCMDLARLSVIEKMKKHSQKTVLLVDGAKLGKKYTYRGFGFDEIDYVVMDTRPADAQLRRVLGKKLITSKSLLP